MLHWAISFMGRGRAERTVTVQQVFARNRAESQIERRHRSIHSVNIVEVNAMKDIEIADRVRVALDRDPWIAHSAEIAVFVQDGSVTLRGAVGSFRQRRAAVGIAKRMRGVRYVEDDLSVDLRDHWEDDEIRGAALQMLMWDVDVPADSVDVKVAAGWLTLKGEVRHQYQSDAAFDDVSRLPAIGGITNEIKVITA